MIQKYHLINLLGGLKIRIFTFTYESQHLTQLRISLCPHKIMSNSLTGKQHMTGLRAQDHSGNKNQGPVVGTQRWDSGNSVPRLYKSWYVSWASGRLPLPGEQDERRSWKLWLATSNRRSEEIWFLCSPKEGKHAQRHCERNGLSDVQYLISRFNY